MAPPDRRSAVIANPDLTGIDFVAIDATQTILDVFFLDDPTAMVPSLEDLTLDQVRITGDDADPEIPLALIEWPPLPIDGRRVLRVTTSRPGGWGRYWLALDDVRVDPFFARLEIDFKAACPSTLDCAPPDHVCPPDDDEGIVVDGMARDFWSLRRALLDFAARRNPRWVDRIEADVGVMFVEALAALGDEMAYYQDRVAREVQFGSASQRRSLRRHARLVDYEPSDGLGARGHLAVHVAQGFPPGFRLVPAGTDVWARREGTRPIPFEIGKGLADALAGTTYRVAAARNKLAAHQWDGDDPDPHAAHRPLPSLCLFAGARMLHVNNALHEADFSPGEQVFLVTEPVEKDLPVRVQLVTLTAVTNEVDPLGNVLGTTREITKLEWEEPTLFDFDLHHTFVLGNVVPVTAGVTRELVFSIGPSDQPVPPAIERSGPDGSIAFSITLPDREGDRLVRLGADPQLAAPEIDLAETSPPLWGLGLPWEWRRRLLGTNSSTQHDRHYTLDDGTWDRAVAYQRIGETIVHRDYIANVGTTLRFGDGEFGRLPARGDVGAGRFFRAMFRLGNGERGNVPPSAVRHADPNGELGFADFGLPFIERVWNPAPIAGGREPETLDEIRRDAPEAYRAITYRAVRPEDFDEIAERLPWVQRAHTEFRWTGSWLTAFTAADARGRSTLPSSMRRELADHLDRHRQAGREVHVLAPRYADLDLRIVICVEPTSYPADVVLGSLRALATFFAPDHFAFGIPLDRSELEATVQRVPGVRAVRSIHIARRGWFAEKEMVEPYFQPAAHEVVRVDNNPRHPDRGTVTIQAEGGA